MDCDSLCILTGKYAWNIQCELSLLNNDGNLIDAFNYAAIIALHQYRLPFVTVERGKLHVWSFEEKTSDFEYPPLANYYDFWGYEPSREGWENY